MILNVRHSNACVLADHETSATARVNASAATGNTIAATCTHSGGQKQAHVMFVILDDAGWNDFDFQV